MVQFTEVLDPMTAVNPLSPRIFCDSVISLPVFSALF